MANTQLLDFYKMLKILKLTPMGFATALPDLQYFGGQSTSPYLDGKMNEVRISNIARSQKEIQQLMKIGIKDVLAVTPKDKLATTWGQLKLRFVK